MKRLIISGSVLALLALPLGSVLRSPVVEAAYPGQNGRVLWLNSDKDQWAATLKTSELDGSDEQELFSDDNNNLLGFDSSADGSMIVHNVSIDGVRHVAVMNVDGSDYRVITQDTPEDDYWYAAAPSFSPDGSKVIFNEFWESNEGFECSVSTVNVDGSGKNRLWTSSLRSVNHSSGNTEQYDVGSCDLLPIFSPDGSKIAFLRDEVFDTEATATYSRTSVYLAASNGSGATKLASVTPEDMDSQYFLPDSGLVDVSLDWSPDSQKLLYNMGPISGGDPQADMAIVNLQGSVSVVKSSMNLDFYKEDIAGTREAFLFPRFSPDGNIVTTKVALTSDGETLTDVIESIELISTTGSPVQTLRSADVSITKDGPTLVFYKPAILPIVTDDPSDPGNTPNPNTQDPTNVRNLTNPVTNKPVQLTTPDSTNITCAETAKEDALSAQDGDYQYPVGLVDFCFDTAATNNEVNLVFVTDLTSEQVKARKYNSDTNTYFDVQGASITTVSHQGQNALKVTYSITDNGDLDLDKTTGKIKDPIGLAVTNDLAKELGETGVNTTLVTIVAAVTTLTALYGMKRRGVRFRVN